MLQYIVINLVTLPKTGDKEIILPVICASYLAVKKGKTERMCSNEDKISFILLSGIDSANELESQVIPNHSRILTGLKLDLSSLMRNPAYNKDCLTKSEYFLQSSKVFVIPYPSSKYKTILIECFLQNLTIDLNI
jgi:hypothetical protein